LLNEQGDRVELLSLLHSLVARYKDDAEVQAQLADVYQNLGNMTRAERHFRHMLHCDPRSKLTRLRFAQFAAKAGLVDETKALLAELSREPLDTATWQEVQWLHAVIATIDKDHTTAVQHVESILQVDPWNVTYLVLYCLNQAIVLDPEYNAEVQDSVVFKLHVGIEQNLDWAEYDAMTKKLLAQNRHALSYQREKLKFLYLDGQRNALKDVIAIATKFNPTRGFCDLLKLLNTNYDSPSIYLGLGTLQKELWQLEAASTWFEATIALPKVSDEDKAAAQLELADCYIWRNINLTKATELAKLSMELNDKEQNRASLVLLHAHLKVGQIREAKSYLSRLEIQGNSDAEFLFLKGLMAYRNGAVTEAKGIWKGLLVHRTETIRFHHIKTELMKFYYDGAPYLQTHLSM
jgi:tetratricopeptide (TPR) repeat protein